MVSMEFVLRIGGITWLASLVAAKKADEAGSDSNP